MLDIIIKYLKFKIMADADYDPDFDDEAQAPQEQ